MFAFGQNTEAAIMGDYPTLRDLDHAYGPGFSAEWIVPIIDKVSLSTSAKNPVEEQQIQLAKIISTEYAHLKITEILLFFYRFKSGRYGRFYGAVDPMVITCAMRDFIEERNQMIATFESKREFNKPKGDVITFEQWRKEKQEKGEDILHDNNPLNLKTTKI